jgi:Transposase DNA-binding
MSVALTLTALPESLFPDLDLGDVRRERRFRTVVQAIIANPGASLPQIFPNPTAYHACLDLFDAEQCTHAKILGVHQEAVLNALELRTEPTLLLHDTTVLDFTGHTTLEDDLGPVGNGTGRGWLAHQTLAVDPTNRTVLGLVSQILHVRVSPPEVESVAQKREREGRESRLWRRGLDEIGPTPVGCPWIDVADRGADIFEFLQALSDGQRRFVVRSKSNRALGTGPSDEKSSGLLHDRLRVQPATAHWDLHLPARTGQVARTVCLSAASQRVVLRPPQVRKGHFRREPLELTAVRVWEVDPPAGTDALEWLLLTSEDATTAEDLKRVADWYACRMQIEEFHKVQKSGTRIEGPQVQSVEKMAALVALLSVIAVGMMNLRLAVRTPELAEKPARELVPAVWVAVLSQYQTGEPKDWTAGQFWVNLARLGGYLKNPKKHPPGWITLWRGWTLLQRLVQYELRSTPKIP